MQFEGNGGGANSLATREESSIKMKRNASGLTQGAKHVHEWRRTFEDSLVAHQYRGSHAVRLSPEGAGEGSCSAI
jgi:hypothetical protein